MDILDITANILPKMHGSIQYRCNQYKIKHTDTKNKILKVYLDGGEQLLLPDFCNLVSADFFSLSFEKKNWCQKFSRISQAEWSKWQIWTLWLNMIQSCPVDQSLKNLSVVWNKLLWRLPEFASKWIKGLSKVIDVNWKHRQYFRDCGSNLPFRLEIMVNFFLVFRNLMLPGEVFDALFTGYFPS